MTASRSTIPKVLRLTYTYLLTLIGFTWGLLGIIAVLQGGGTAN
jgi:hypothetical protein